MRPSPLHEELAAAGASLAERDGWLVAASYGNVAAEHAAARTAGVADRSARGLVRVSGRDAAKLLQGIVTNDVEALAVGEACFALLLTPKGRPVADLRVLREDEAAFVVECEPQAHDAVASALRRYRLASRADIADARGSVALLAVLGEAVPPADERLRPLPEGVGLELVGPVAAVREAWRALLDGGARPVGADVFEVLRVEQGVPRLGADVDEGVLPAEAGLVERGVSFTKGCFIGQEPVARLRYRGHANRTLRRLVFAGTVPELPASLHAGGRRRRAGDQCRARARRTGDRARLRPPRGSGRRDAGRARRRRRRGRGAGRAAAAALGRLTRLPRMRPARFERATSASAGLRSIP